MSKISLQFKPVNGLRSILAERHAEADHRGHSSRRRSTAFQFKPSGIHCPLEIVLEEPGAGMPGDHISYVLTADMAGLLIGRQAFTSNMVLACAELMLRLFKLWMMKTFLGIPADLLASVTPSQCVLKSVTATYYFKLPAEADAYRVELALQNTSKVLLDCGSRFPHKRPSKGPQPPLVSSDPDVRSAFSIQLRHLPHREPFGVAQVLVARDVHQFPATFSKLALADREAIAAATRSILQVNVTTDISKPIHTGGDEDHRLPHDFRNWTPEKFPANPFEIIWDALRYALWLNQPLATIEEDIDRSILNDAELEVLDAYIAGETISPTGAFFYDEDAFLSMRRDLIRKAKVDILTPWAVLKLNQVAELGPLLAFENRFAPEKDVTFAAHTLSPKTLEPIRQVLNQTLPELSDDGAGALELAVAAVEES